jgi:hypothetical protein
METESEICSVQGGADPQALGQAERHERHPGNNLDEFASGPTVILVVSHSE